MRVGFVVGDRGSWLGPVPRHAPLSPTKNARNQTGPPTLMSSEVGPGLFGLLNWYFGI